MNAAEIALHKQNVPNASKFRFQNTEFTFKQAYSNYEQNHLTPERIEERLTQLEEEFRKIGEYQDWSSEKIKEFGRSIIVDQNDTNRESMMTKTVRR